MYVLIIGRHLDRRSERGGGRFGIFGVLGKGELYARSCKCRCLLVIRGTTRQVVEVTRLGGGEKR